MDRLLTCHDQQIVCLRHPRSLLRLGCPRLATESPPGLPGAGPGVQLVVGSVLSDLRGPCQNLGGRGGGPDRAGAEIPLCAVRLHRQRQRRLHRRHHLDVRGVPADRDALGRGGGEVLRLRHPAHFVRHHDGHGGYGRGLRARAPVDPAWHLDAAAGQVRADGGAGDGQHGSAGKYCEVPFCGLLQRDGGPLV